MGGWVPISHLIDAVYGYNPTISADNTICVVISGLRDLGFHITGRNFFGYKLDCDPEPRVCECGWEARPMFPSPESEMVDGFLTKKEAVVLRILQRSTPLMSEMASELGSTPGCTKVLVSHLRKKLKPGWEIVSEGRSWYQDGGATYHLKSL